MWKLSFLFNLRQYVNMNQGASPVRRKTWSSKKCHFSSPPLWSSHTLMHTHKHSMLNYVCCPWPFSDRVIHYDVSAVTRPNYAAVESLFPTQWVCVHGRGHGVCVCAHLCAVVAREWLYPVVGFRSYPGSSQINWHTRVELFKVLFGVHTHRHQHTQTDRRSLLESNHALSPLLAGCQWFTYSVFHVQLIGSWPSLRPCMVFTKGCCVGQPHTWGQCTVKHVNTPTLNTLTLSLVW